MLVGLGDDLESANAAVMYHARRLVAAAQAGNDSQKEWSAIDDPPEAKVWQENWYDALTYCGFSGSPSILYTDYTRHVERSRPKIDRREGASCC